MRRCDPGMRLLLLHGSDSNSISRRRHRRRSRSCSSSRRRFVIAGGDAAARRHTIVIEGMVPLGYTGSTVARGRHWRRRKRRKTGELIFTNERLVEFRIIHPDIHTINTDVMWMKMVMMTLMILPGHCSNSIALIVCIYRCALCYSACKCISVFQWTSN